MYDGKVCHVSHQYVVWLYSGKKFYDHIIILFGDLEVSLYYLLIVGAYNYEKGIAILKHNDPSNALRLAMVMLRNYLKSYHYNNT